MQHTSKEWVKVWHDPVLGGLELHSELLQNWPGGKSESLSSQPQ